jgi:hypothetical protein
MESALEGNDGGREKRNKVNAIIDQEAGKHVLTCVPTVLVVMLDCSLSLSLSLMILFWLHLSLMI